MGKLFFLDFVMHKSFEENSSKYICRDFVSLQIKSFF